MSQNKLPAETVIDFDGIKIKLIRKKIRNINIHVKAPLGIVTVSAPANTGMDEIMKFLDLKKEWIHEQVKKMKKVSELTERHYLTGETIPVWGEDYRLVLIHSKSRKNITLDPLARSVIMTANAHAPVYERELLARKLCKREMEDRLSSIIPKMCEATNLYPSEYRCRFMTSRWGTCNTRTGVITLNLTLCRYDEKFLIYVLLHEFMHLAVPNHGPRFKELMSFFMPEWRELKEELDNQVYKYTEVRKET